MLNPINANTGFKDVHSIPSESEKSSFFMELLPKMFFFVPVKAEYRPLYRAVDNNRSLILFTARAKAENTYHTLVLK